MAFEIMKNLPIKNFFLHSLFSILSLLTSFICKRKRQNGTTQNGTQQKIGQNGEQ